MSNPGNFAPEAIARLASAHEDYQTTVSAHYDEVLHEVARRVDEAQSIGKSDIAALVFWKRLRADTPWVPRLMECPDADVRAKTAVAVAAVRDTTIPTWEAAGTGRSALAALPGLLRGDALASALLLSAAPQRMAVYDRRAHQALELLGITLSSRPGRYRRYMEILEQLRQAVNARGAEWTNRDVDQALYWLGGS
ncbi:hypothetical protein [Granulicoccus sp. GXG6511]|uniref:hypothetical protein n=1 Tax=Granulicoccus sp. GXG6511 TaxID=3381351 RepID=UPI003D7D54BF